MGNDHHNDTELASCLYEDMITSPKVAIVETIVYITHVKKYILISIETLGIDKDDGIENTPSLSKSTEEYYDPFEFDWIHVTTSTTTSMEQEIYIE